MDSLSGFLGCGPVKGSLSLDRVTFLVFSPGLSLWGSDTDRSKRNIEKMSGLVEKLLSDKFDSDFPQGIPSELFKKHYRTTSGIDIQFGPVMPRRKKIKDSDYILAFGTEEDKENGFMFKSFPNEYAFRVEYNPNESDLSEIKILLQNVRYSGVTASLVRIARLDIAVDYACDLNPALALCDRLKKSFIACGSSGIETIYFGSRASKYYIRIYNKAVEMREKHNIEHDSPLWRFELESKESFSLDHSPDFSGILQRFSFYSGAVRSDDWKLNLLLAYAKENGLKAALSFLPETTSKRYKKYLSEFDSLPGVESPFSAYEREFKQAFDLLRMKILACLGYDFTFENEAV